MGVDFSRIADTYDEARGGLRRGTDFAAELAPRLPAGPGLEVGIGTGVVAASLNSYGRSPLGVDISRAMSAKARDRLGRRVALYDGRRLPFADGVFTAAYAVWVMHVVQDQARLFAEVRRVVGPGGRFLIEPINYPPDDELARVTAPMWKTLLGGRESRDDLDRLTEIARTEGWIEIARLPGHHHPDKTTPAAPIARLESRDSPLSRGLSQ